MDSTTATSLLELAEQISPGLSGPTAGEFLERLDAGSDEMLAAIAWFQFLVASEASNLSMVERQLGNLDAAEELAREALVVGRRIGDEFTKPFAISGLAAIATKRGEGERAATLLGAAEAMMEAQKMEWPPDERPHYEHMLAELPKAMGAAEFARARKAGQLMASAEAVAFALA